MTYQTNRRTETSTVTCYVCILISVCLSFEFLVRVCYVISRNVVGSRLCAYMYVYHMYESVGIVDLGLSHWPQGRGRDDYTLRRVPS